MKEFETYILFPSHSDGIALEKQLIHHNIRYTIVPTPRTLSKCCGISLKINPEDKERVEDILRKNQSIAYEGIHTIEKRKSSLFNF